MADAFELQEKFRAADVGCEEVNGNIPEVSGEHIPDNFHVLRTAYIDAYEIKTEAGTVL